VPQPPPVIGKSWVIGDLSSNQVLAAAKSDERVEPASLTKLMTAYLVFAALRDRKLTLEQQPRVSEARLHAPGSRMFIQPGRPVSVDELIRGMVVQSGNDACIALAECDCRRRRGLRADDEPRAERLGMKEQPLHEFLGAARRAALHEPRRNLYLLTAALIRDFPELYGE